MHCAGNWDRSDEICDGCRFRHRFKCKKEYRPKLFKRLRTFTWVDPVHETVRLTPVIFDSDVEILHKPQNFHSKRDFSIFIKNFQSGHELSPKIRTMYAKELLKTGDTKDFQDAKPIFQYILEHDLSDDAMKEASCVLAHVYRLEDNKMNFSSWRWRICWPLHVPRSAMSLVPIFSRRKI